MQKISLPKTRLFTIFFLIISIAFSFVFRLYFSSEILPPPRRMQGETTQAYRYVRDISTGSGVPDIDTMVMYPTGMNTSENSIFEEYIAGYLHRVVGGDLDTFLRVFCLLFPLLVIPALYLWMQAAGFPGFSSLIGASLYGFLFPALLRTRGGSMYRETVALPLIIFLGWSVEKALDSTEKECRIYSLVSGILLFVALAAWKVTAFIALFIFIYLHIRNIRNRSPKWLVLSLALSQLSASLILSHMRHDGAIFSPASILALLLVPATFLATKYRKHVSIVCILTSILASLMIAAGSTGHVSAVIFAKFRHLFSHPADPLMLTPDARLFWVSGYTSPSLAQFLLLFGIPIIVSFAGIPEFFRTYRARMFFWFLPLALTGYLFFDRLHIFLAVALIPLLALAIRRGKVFILIICTLIIIQSLLPVQTAHALSKTGLHLENASSLLTDNEFENLLGWFERKTKPGNAVLAYWHISGLISAYAERPVVTHTFFENTENRRTIQEFARMLFLPEDSLVSFMRDKQCNLIIYQADFLLDRSPSGVLYLAGHTEIPVGCSGYSMHYSPETLEHLSLIFQTNSLRVFSLESTVVPDPLDRSIFFEERYKEIIGDYGRANAIIYNPLSASGRLADEGIEFHEPDKVSAALLLALNEGADSEIMYNMLNDLIQMYISSNYSIENVADDIHSYLYYSGSQPELRLFLARLYTAEGMIESALEEYEIIMELHPDMPEIPKEYEAVRNELYR